MKNAQAIAPDETTTNARQNNTAKQSNTACAGSQLSNAERADIRNRVDALLKRFMERRSEFGAGGAFDAVTRPSLLTVDRPGLMDAKAGAKTETSLPAAAGGFAQSATGSYAAAGASVRETAHGSVNSDGGENRIITPPTFPGA